MGRKLRITALVVGAPITGLAAGQGLFFGWLSLLTLGETYGHKGFLWTSAAIGVALTVAWAALLFAKPSPISELRRAVLLLVAVAIAALSFWSVRNNFDLI